MKTRTCIVTLIVGAVIAGTPVVAAHADGAQASRGTPSTSTPAPTPTQPEPTTPTTTPEPPPTTTTPEPPPTTTTPEPPPATTTSQPPPAPPPAQQTASQTTPSQSPWSNCALTSAGLVCPGGTTTCFVTSGGVTCPLNCAVASAVKSSCPEGIVAPNPRGGVLGQPPISGGRTKHKAGKQPGVPSENNPGQLTPVAFSGKAGGGELPFTGLELLPLATLGLALVVAGFVLLRGTSSASAGAEPVGVEAIPVHPVAADPSPPRTPGIAVQGLVLVAYGLLLRRRSRH